MFWRARNTLRPKDVSQKVNSEPNTLFEYIAASDLTRMQSLGLAHRANN